MSDPTCVNTIQSQENQEQEVDYSDVPQNDPFKSLPKSHMNLSTCKNNYFIARKNKQNYFDEAFWNTFDSVGYSVHGGSYKYNDEFSPLAFIRRNVVMGIVQSMDSTVAHKNLFGVFKLYTNKILECVFITRGDSMCIECAGDMVESFDFTKLDTTNENVRKDIGEFFNKEEDNSIEFYVRFV
jgi:hypothetical protein